MDMSQECLYLISFLSHPDSPIFVPCNLLKETAPVPSPVNPDGKEEGPNEQIEQDPDRKEGSLEERGGRGGRGSVTGISSSFSQQIDFRGRQKYEKDDPAQYPGEKNVLKDFHLLCLFD
jgi:hypothetical protein